MIPTHREAEILRLFHAEKWRVGTIATQLGMHHSTVTRVLAQAGCPKTTLTRAPSLVDPFVPFMVETLEKYPRLCASRLFAMVKERGYPGGPDHFRSMVARHRPRPKAEAYLRLRTLPGDQAQVDWGHFGKVKIGKAQRALMAFVMVLSFSRHIFLRFYYGAAMPCFLRGHVDAYEFFGGVARVSLYDNLKSAVLERAGSAIHFNPAVLELAAHYRFEVRPVAPARGNQKGRVERAIRYVRNSFFAARTWTDLEDLNGQALAWCLGTAADRPCPEDRAQTVREVFAGEKSLLLKLPDNPFPVDETVPVHIGKTPYARFDLNDYSVPYGFVKRTLNVVASLDTVRIIDGSNVIATHVRSWDRGQQVEDPSHIQELQDQKQAAREHRGMDLLHHAAPSSGALLREIAQRGGNLGSVTSTLLRLHKLYGAAALERAIAAAIAKGSPSLSAIRQLLDLNRQASGKPVPIAAELPDDPRVRTLVVRPHALETYDHLTKEFCDDTPKKS